MLHFDRACPERSQMGQQDKKRREKLEVRGQKLEKDKKDPDGSGCRFAPL
ncbi:MAG: hypothetical protein H8D47_05005 [Planctomycetes bacterium]|nr:hypothetical protein [Planctomycetota bacterium]